MNSFEKRALLYKYALTAKRILEKQAAGRTEYMGPPTTPDPVNVPQWAVNANHHAMPWLYPLMLSGFGPVGMTLGYGMGKLDQQLTDKDVEDYGTKLIQKNIDKMENELIDNRAKRQLQMGGKPQDTHFVP